MSNTAFVRGGAGVVRGQWEHGRYGEGDLMAQCEVCGNDCDKAFCMLLTNFASASLSPAGRSSLGGAKR